MKFIETTLKDAYVIEIEPQEDQRGFFARTFCKKEFEEKGLNPNIAQTSISYNKIKGTIRGMHYQDVPYQEAKVVSCLKGEIQDVIIDLRPNSPTYCQWFSSFLSWENHRMLYIPEGFAHGFQTLVDDTIVFYQMSEFYYPEYQRGIRWDDPCFGIKWQYPPSVITEKDKSYPLYERA